MSRRTYNPLPIRDGLNASQVRVPAEAAGITAVAFIRHLIESQTHRHPDDDEAAIAQRFSDGLVVGRDGTPFQPDQPLPAGTDVWFYRTPREEPEIPGRISIVHQDDDLVVIDKPHFMATIPRGQHITQTATVQLRKMLDIPELVPAHRLDRLTAGLLVFTTRPEIRGAYQDLFQRRRVEKRYLALAPLLDRATPFTVRNRILKEPGIVQAWVVDGEPNAETIVEKITPTELIDVQGRQLALWTLRPITGRTHQLRLHLNGLGAPIVGDSLYPVFTRPADDDFSHPLQLLASELRFVDPLTSKERQFSTKLELGNF
ncbi:pseudouridine synthase [Corynebacterium ulceribovis]|uniref:pseudouridine synthase n=1 Tax=Corynebacterium ulceribovis TaxID=487732 RepID=UPI000362462F|nr:pseudouridine synthase [Corynebacterium ulceribovis]